MNNNHVVEFSLVHSVIRSHESLVIDYTVTQCLDRPSTDHSTDVQKPKKQKKTKKPLET